MNFSFHLKKFNLSRGNIWNDMEFNPIKLIFTEDQCDVYEAEIYLLKMCARLLKDIHLEEGINSSICRQARNLISIWKIRQLRGQIQAFHTISHFGVELFVQTFLQREQLCKYPCHLHNMILPQDGQNTQT